MSDRRVVITGLGVFTSLGRGIEPFWRSLLDGRSGIRRFQGFDVSAYDCQIAAEIPDFDVTQYIPFKDARRMDRFCHFGVIASDLAVQDAGLDLDRVDRARTGDLHKVLAVLELVNDRAALAQQAQGGKCSELRVENRQLLEVAQLARHRVCFGQCHCRCQRVAQWDQP